MPRVQKRETLIALRAMHTAHRVANEVGNPPLRVSQPQRVLPVFPDTGPLVHTLPNNRLRRWLIFVFFLLLVISILIRVHS